MKLTLGTPSRTLLDAALILGPLAYLFVDITYVARGWWDAQTGALHILLAALYGLTALRLVTFARGRMQAVLLVVTMLGVVGNAGVGVDTLSVGLGGLDLFQQEGPANLFKMMGFFFPLTLLVAAAALWRRLPAWETALLAVGAALFPVAHVQNLAWLVILDQVLLVLALGYLFTARHELDAPPEPAAEPDPVRVA